MTTIDVDKYNKILDQWGSGPCCPSHVGRSAEIIKELGITGSLLDIGCGTGDWTEFFAKIGFDSRGVDIDLSVVKKEFQQDRFFRGEMHDLPFKRGVFDVCFSNGVFEHSIAPFVAACEMNRVLKTGGHAILVVPTERNTRLIYMHQHISIFNEDGYKNLFMKSGFVLVRNEVFWGENKDEHYILAFQKIKEAE